MESLRNPEFFEGIKLAQAILASFWRVTLSLSFLSSMYPLFLSSPYASESPFVSDHVIKPKFIQRQYSSNIYWVPPDCQVLLLYTREPKHTQSRDMEQIKKQFNKWPKCMVSALKQGGVYGREGKNTDLTYLKGSRSASQRKEFLH